MTHLDVAQLAGDALLILTAALATACVVAYQWTTGGAWRDSSTGRHVMSFMASIAAVTLLGAVRAVAVDVLHAVDPAWFVAVRIAVFASVPVVLAWRLIVVLDSARDHGAGR